MSDVIVFGTGRLARSLMRALAAIAPDRLAIRVVGRSLSRATEVAVLTRADAAAFGKRIDITPCEADMTTDSGVAAVLRQTACHCAVVAASSQSPYEKLDHPSAWTDLLQEGGFALTAPANAVLPARVLKALDASGSNTTLVNGAFPDAVNPALARLTDRQVVGFGNVGTIAAFLQAPEPQGTPSRRRILAHHAHLSRPAVPGNDVRIWDGAQIVAPDPTALTAMRSVSRLDLNNIAGISGAALVSALVTGAPLFGHAAGPLGLPGGYPIALADGIIRLDLPTGLSQDDAVALNARWAQMDGIASHVGGHISLSLPLRARLRRLACDAPDILDLSDHKAVRGTAQIMDEVRYRLRAIPGLGLASPISTKNQKSKREGEGYEE